MDVLQQEDVPYGNDWDSATEAAGYGEAADRARPWRAEIRDHIAARVATLAPRARVLELGSGAARGSYGFELDLRRRSSSDHFVTTLGPTRVPIGNGMNQPSHTASTVRS